MSDDVLSGKKIILGVTGGIAAYKSCYLVRELVQRGAEVRVVLTPSALEFIAPLTFSSLSKNNVIVNTFPSSQTSGCEVNTWHIDYGTWADLMIIAPATINTVAKIAHGFADNALTTVVAALRCPLLIAPAADVDMYMNKTTQENISKLKELGHFIVDAEDGELASV
jgi:phosphopantothenoylcysteine decarboxylase / phosphopantothenate---cysteine ligase